MHSQLLVAALKVAVDQGAFGIVIDLFQSFVYSSYDYGKDMDLYT